MLWSVEKGVINYLHRLYFHFFFFFAKINGTNIILCMCSIYRHIVRM